MDTQREHFLGLCLAIPEKRLMYELENSIFVHPFTRQREGDEVIVGRPETGLFVAVPCEALELLDDLKSGLTIQEVSDKYYRNHGEKPDVIGFLKGLEPYRIFELPGPEVDAAKNSNQHQSTRKVRRFHFTSIPQWFAAALFGRVALFSYLIMVCAAVVLCAIHPQLITGRRDLYFPDHRTISLMGLFALTYVGLFLHEMGHLIAARAVGVQSSMGISNRLWILVAETDLTGLWGVPKTQRYIPLFGGVIVDAVSASLFVFLLFMQDQHLLPIPLVANRIFRATIFASLLRIVFQFSFFVRTDFYYVIAAYLSCNNLMHDTQIYLKNQLAKIIPGMHRVDFSAVQLKQLWAIRIYSLCWLSGRALAFTIFFAVTIPLSFQYFRSLMPAVLRGYSANRDDFTAAVLMGTYVFLPLVLGILLWMKSIFFQERSAA